MGLRVFTLAAQRKVVIILRGLINPRTLTQCVVRLSLLNNNNKSSLCKCCGSRLKGRLSTSPRAGGKTPWSCAVSLQRMTNCYERKSQLSFGLGFLSSRAKPLPENQAIQNRTHRIPSYFVTLVYLFQTKRLGMQFG